MEVELVLCIDFICVYQAFQHRLNTYSWKACMYIPNSSTLLYKIFFFVSDSHLACDVHLIEVFFFTT